MSAVRDRIEALRRSPGWTFLAMLPKVSPGGAVVWWALVGAGLGLGLGMLGPLGRPVLQPMQAMLTGLCDLVGLRSASAYFQD